MKNADSNQKKVVPQKQNNKSDKIKKYITVGLFVISGAYYIINSDMLSSLSKTKNTVNNNVVIDDRSEKSQDILEQKTRDNRHIKTVEAPPVISDTTFNQLQNLYLLVNRVNDKNLKSAAELYGMQRVNLHNKREQIKEYNAAKLVAEEELAMTKAQTQLKEIQKSGVSPSQNGDLNKTVSQQNPNVPEEIDPERRDAFDNNQTNNPQKDITLSPSVTKADINVKMILRVDNLIKAYITINNKPYRNVRTGQIVASRFRVNKINEKTSCIDMTDTDLKQDFTTCNNG